MLTSMNNLSFTWKGMGRYKDALDMDTACYEHRVETSKGPRSGIEVRLSWVRQIQATNSHVAGIGDDQQLQHSRERGKLIQ